MMEQIDEENQVSKSINNAQFLTANYQAKQ
jgi:hypothetical protein